MSSDRWNPNSPEQNHSNNLLGALVVPLLVLITFCHHPCDMGRVLFIFLRSNVSWCSNHIKMKNVGIKFEAFSIRYLWIRSWWSTILHFLLKQTQNTFTFCFDLLQSGIINKVWAWSEFKSCINKVKYNFCEFEETILTLRN